MPRPIAMIRVDGYVVESIYPTVGDAARASGCNYQRVWDNAKYKRGSRDSDYIFRYVDEVDIVGPQRYRKKVYCYDRIDDKLMTFPSPKHAAKMLGTTADYIRNAICKEFAVFNRYDLSYAA